jgi:flagellar protein FliS
MNPQAAQSYLRTRVLTATPEQLQLMLFDGALRFAEQAKAALQKKNFEQSFHNISRSQAIITQMNGSLKHDVFPELCGKLAALYNYVYRKLLDANVHHKVEALDDAIRHLRFQRQTWALLLDQIGKQKAAQAAQKMDMPEPSSQMEASISING